AFIQAKLWQPPQGSAALSAVSEASRRDACATLFHRWRDGERDSVQLLDAYAFLLAGVMDLYEATLDPKHLEFAVALADTMLPKAVPYLLLALDYWIEEPKRAVIVGDPNAADTRALIHAAHSVYQPNKVVLGNSGPVEPFAKTLPTKDAPVVFLCTGTACQPP